MPRREDDDVARGPARPSSRALAQAGGFVLAGAATLAVFLTEDAQLLRLAVVAVAWAFVLATFAAGRRGSDGAQAAAREADLRLAYEQELEREVAARREFELELEHQLRRESEDSMRTELDAIRREIASLADLRDEVARVSSLRGDIVALGGLREEVARVAALRDDVAGLTALRGELGQLAALREDMGRLRAELAEQLSSEMLVERIVMRTQASRLPGDLPRIDGPARTLEGTDWSDEVPPRELTGGWPAIRLDEPRPTQQFEQVRSSSWQPVGPSTTAFAAAAAAPLAPMPDRSADPAPAPAPPLAAAPPTVVPASLPAAVEAPGATAYEPQPSYLAADRHAEPPRSPAAPQRQVPPAFDRHTRASAHDADPLLGSSWTTSAPSTAAPPTVASPVVTPSAVLPPAPVPPERPAAWTPPPALDALDDGYRRRRTDEPPARPLAAAYAPTTEHPPAAFSWSDPQPAGSGAGPEISDRPARVLAENGPAQPGGRRRRRYREDGESDDVLARVLGRD